MRIYSALAILALFVICGNTAPLNAKRQWDGSPEEQSQRNQGIQDAHQAQENQQSMEDHDNQNRESYNAADGNEASSWN